MLVVPLNKLLHQPNLHKINLNYPNVPITLPMCHCIAQNAEAFSVLKLNYLT